MLEAFADWSQGNLQSSAAGQWLGCLLQAVQLSQCVAWGVLGSTPGHPRRWAADLGEEWNLRVVHKAASQPARRVAFVLCAFMMAS